MTQSTISRLESRGGTVPTIGVLEGLATALSAALVVTLTQGRLTRTGQR